MKNYLLQHSQGKFIDQIKKLRLNSAVDANGSLITRRILPEITNSNNNFNTNSEPNRK